MSIRIKTAKGTGECLGNFIRQIGMTCTESFRVVGFTLHNNNSVNLYKVQNAFQLGGILHNLDVTFREEPSGNFASLDYVFSGELKFADLSNDKIKVKYKDTPYNRTQLNKESIPILSSPDAGESRLTLYFRKSRGIHSVDANKQFLELQLQGVDNTLVALGSNHSEVVTCGYSVEETAGETDVLEMHIEGVDGSEAELFQKFLKFGISLLQTEVSS